MRQSLKCLVAAVRNRDIRRYELAWAVAVSVEWAHLVALGLFAYHFGGTAMVGVAGLVRLLPAGAVAPFAAGLGDRFRRERLLLVVFACELVALVGSGVAALAGADLLVLALAAVVGIMTTMVRATTGSILPSLARTPAELITCNAASSTFEGLGVVLGPLLVGLAVLLVPVGVVFIGAGAALLGAIALTSRVRIVAAAAVAAAPDTPRARPTPGPALRFIAGSQRVQLSLGLLAVQCFVRGCLNVFTVVISYQLFHSGSSGVGYLNAAVGVGGLVAALGTTMLRSRRLAVTFGVGLIFWGVPLVAIAGVSRLALAIPCLVLLGAANATEDVSVQTLIQRVTPESVLSGVFGLLWGMSMLAVAVGSIVTPLVVVWAGVRGGLLAVGLILPVLVVLSSRQLLRMDGGYEPTQELAVLETVPMFAPLSLAVKERVAASLSRQQVGVGETVIRAGEPGDSFFIVASGDLEVEKEGLRLRSVGPGDYFGEIALVEDIPRTASVRAKADSVLYGIGREVFLNAVTAHPVAHAAALSVAEARPGGRPASPRGEARGENGG